jgi:hypothetical protein
MKTARIPGLLSLAALCLLLTSCFDSKVPLSDPGDSKPDQRLADVWRLRNDDGSVTYYHIGHPGDSLPQSVMRVIGIQHTTDGEIKLEGQLLIFPTTIGEKAYLNVADGEDKQIKLVEEKGWTPETVSSYWIFMYEITGDTLKIWTMDREAKETAIKSGKVKGKIEEDKEKFAVTTVIFTDTTENLAKFVAEAGDDLFSKDAVRLERVK